MDGFVEREFDIQESDGKIQSLKVKIFQPIQKSEDYWACGFEIHDIYDVKKREVYGVDSMQALRNALKVLEAEIGAYQRKYGGRITFADQEQLWL